MAQGRAFHFCCHRRTLKWIALLTLLSQLLLLLIIAYLKKENADKLSVNIFLNERKPLLDIFTTFTDNPKKVDIYKNTLMNWVHLDPAIRTRIFTDSSLPSTLDCHQNISVYPLTRTNQYGYPFLKDMYYEAEKISRGEFIGFTNADILFDEGLLETIMAAKEYFKDVQNTSVLVVGNRINAEIAYAQNSLYEKHEVKKFTKDYANNNYHTAKSTDYLFIKNIPFFPWHSIKDVVIGTIGFDGYMTHVANQAGVNVVDATKTILALHQTGLDGNHASKAPDHKGILFNRNLTKVTLRCGTSVPAAKFYSGKDIGGAVKIFIRNQTTIDALCKNRRQKQPHRN